MVAPTPNPVKALYEQIKNCNQPEDLFGDLGPTQSKQLFALEVSYKSLVKLYHPDRYAHLPSDLFYVTEITKFLNSLKQVAVIKIKSGVYGNLSDYSSVIKTVNHEYFVTRLMVEASLSDIYHAYYLDPHDKAQPKKEVVIKIITTPTNNALVEQEIAFYQSLAHFCFPNFIESFCTADRKRAVVLGYIADGYDLIELKKNYCQQYQEPGLPQEHLFWMLDRFLCALGLLHQHQILHGNIQPDNLMIQPQTHNGLLIDFLHCRISPAPDEVFAVVNPAYCAPEVLTQRFKPHPVSDIYALGCSIIELLGGTNNRLDDSIVIHPLLRSFLQKMVIPDPARRAADAWALAEELRSLRHLLYGAKHQFIPLDLGGSYGRR